MSQFRFEEFEIWKDAIELAEKLFDLADNIENKKLYKFAEQLRGAAMSISNNIAEGAGAFSKKEFAYFLNIARRSAFECANILVLFYRKKLLDQERKEILMGELAILSRKITNFRKTLLKNL